MERQSRRESCLGCQLKVAKLMLVLLHNFHTHLAEAHDALLLSIMTNKFP